MFVKVGETDCKPSLTRLISHSRQFWNQNKQSSIASVLDITTGFNRINCTVNHTDLYLSSASVALSHRVCNPETTGFHFEQHRIQRKRTPARCKQISFYRLFMFFLSWELIPSSRGPQSCMLGTRVFYRIASYIKFTQRATRVCYDYPQ